MLSAFSAGYAFTGNAGMRLEQGINSTKVINIQTRRILELVPSRPHLPTAPPIPALPPSLPALNTPTR